MVQLQKMALNYETNQYIRISRGGNNTKIHAVVDALGNPIHVQLNAGNIHDISVAKEVLSNINIDNSILMADKTYGTIDFHEYIAT